jgi:hypothetical protein
MQLNRRRGCLGGLTSRIVISSLLAALLSGSAFAQTGSELERGGEESGRWKPPTHLRAQFQLQGVSDHCKTGGYNARVHGKAFDGSWVSPEAYFIDLYADDGACPQYAPGTPNRDAVRAVHAAGKKAICYVDIGSAEPYRPDYQEFVDFDKRCSGCLLGKTYDSGDPFLSLNNRKGERTFVLAEMEKRLDKCAAAGFDGVYFDVTWEWQVGKDVTGWNISYETQLLYNVAMLNMAHMHNLAAGINYDLLQIKDLVPQEDFHIDESCFDYNECDYLLPVTKAGKPVLQIEYFADPASVCSQQPKPYDFNTEFKNQDLFDHPWSTCR